MPERESATLEAVDAAGNGLRATFFWRVDRYAHRVERLEGGAATPLLESIEGSDLDRWPPSPPLQQLSVETLPDSRLVALLVGMAGASHWSLTAERELGTNSLVFDVACRLKDADGTVGSYYRSHVRHELKRNVVELHRAGGTGEPAILETIEVSPLAAISPCLAIDGRGVRVAIQGGFDAPQTVRWKYRVRVS